MLDTLRRGASSWAAKLLLILLVISFGLWGIADVFRGFRSGVVATVGSTDITEAAFRTAYDRELQRFGRQGLGTISREQAARFGIPSQVLSRLAQEATLDEATRRLHLALPMERVLSEIVNDPQHRAPNGQFDRNYFLAQLRDVGFTEEQYIRERARGELRQQFAEATAGEVQVPKAYLEALWRFREEERILRYVVIDEAALGPLEEATPEALAKFYEERKAAFRAPEYRVAEVMAVDAGAIAAGIQVSEEDIRAAYDRDRARYVTPERRRVLQIPFASRDEAEAALQRLRSGAITFEALQEERKVGPEDADLGLRPKSGFVDPAVAEAAFRLEQGAVSDVVTGRFRPVILKLAEVQPEVAKSYDELKPDIAKTLARSRAEARVPELRNKVEEARDAGTPLPEIAKTLGLPIRIVEVDREGKGPDGNAIADLPGGAALVGKIFESDVGLDNVPHVLGASGVVFYKVAEIKPPRDRPLEEVRDRVLTQWRTEEMRSRLSRKANELLERVKKGETLEAVAEAASLEVKTSDKVKRSTTDNELASAFAAAFQVPEGSAVIGSAGDKFVVMVVQDVFPTFFGETEEIKQVGTELQRQMQDGIVGAVITELQRSLGVSMNQAALERAAGAVQ